MLTEVPSSFPPAQGESDSPPGSWLNRSSSPKNLEDRLGYLLDHFKHSRQAASLRPLALKAKSFKPLDPSVRVVASLARAKAPDAPAWKLGLNVPLEIDA